MLAKNGLMAAAFLGLTIVVGVAAQDDGPAANGAGFQVRPLYEGRAADDVLMVKLAYWFG